MTRTFPLLAQAWLVVICAFSLVACSRQSELSTPTLFERNAAQDAAQTLAKKIKGGPARVRVLNIEITPDTLTLQAQDPAAPTHIDEYRFTQFRPSRRNPHTGRSAPARGLLSWFSWEWTSGPKPVQVNLINPKLEENLFDLADIDFNAVANTVREAEKRVALEDGSAVERIRIQRRLALLPSPRSGDVQWDLEVRSPRETATAYADAKGRITGLNLDGTVRAKAVDMREGGPPLDDAIARIRDHFGKDARVIKNFHFARTYLWFDALDPKNPRNTEQYSCNINGLFKSGLGSLPGIPRLGDEPGGVASLFSIDEVDWSRLTTLKKAALETLAIPGGAVSSINLARPPARGVVAMEPVQWEIAVKGGGEEGTVYFDATNGTVTRTILPPSRRVAIDFTDPEAVRRVLAALRENYGPRARFMKLLFNNNTCVIHAPGIREPAKIQQLSYDQDHFSSMPALDQTAFYQGFTDDWMFDLDEVENFALPILADLKKRTLERLGPTAGSKVERVTFYRHTPFYPDNKKLLVEIRPDKAGYMIFDSRGGIVQTTTP